MRASWPGLCLAAAIVGAAFLAVRHLPLGLDISRAEAQAMIAAERALETPPDIVTLLRGDGAVVAFIGAAPGPLLGYRVTRSSDDAGYTLWVTPTGHAVVGVLYGPEGLLVTEDHLHAVAAERAATTTAPSWPPPPATAADGEPFAPPLPSAAAIDPFPHPPPPQTPRHTAVSTAPGPSPQIIPPPPPVNGFTLGAAGPQVTVFADPACPFSRSTVARFAAAALAGDLRLTVIPVALLGADSAFQALAAVGEAGAAAWFERRTATPTPETAAAVRANNAAFAAAGLDIVPVVRVVTAQGRWRDVPGAIDDVAGFLEGER